MDELHDLIGGGRNIVTIQADDGLITSSEMYAVSLTVNMPVSEYPTVEVLLRGPYTGWAGGLKTYGHKEHWSCPYCNCGNPDKKKLYSWSDVERIFSCLRCGAPRPHFTL